MIRFILCFSFLLVSGAHAVADDRPNILWITIEDWSPDLSCYGTKGIHTPHVDKLASEGIRYERAFTTSPVCSTSRSAMMTGFHQNFIGAHQHRTDNKQTLPHGIRPIPHLFADAGYYTCLMSWKTDCNFLPDKKEELFMGVDWKDRQPDQPFFARVTFGGTHRAWNRDPHEIHNVADDPKYADVKAQLLAELQRWRDEVIHDTSVSDDFRGDGVFPETRPTATVGEWVQQNAEKYDFKKHGVPSGYPTRTLEEWQRVREMWEPWVFREPDSDMKRPVIAFTKKPKDRGKK